MAVKQATSPDVRTKPCARELLLRDWIIGPSPCFSSGTASWAATNLRNDVAELRHGGQWDSNPVQVRLSSATSHVAARWRSWAESSLGVWPVAGPGQWLGQILITWHYNYSDICHFRFSPLDFVKTRPFLVLKSECILREYKNLDNDRKLD